MKTQKALRLANGQPAISCFNLRLDQLAPRQEQATQRFEQALREQTQPLPSEERLRETAAIAQRILWYPDFLAGLRLLVCDTPLFRLTADLPSQLQEANGDQNLDFWDYCYVADLLRQCLGDSNPKGDRKVLQRALAWVEEQALSYQREDSASLH